MLILLQQVQHAQIQPVPHVNLSRLSLIFMMQDKAILLCPKITLLITSLYAMPIYSFLCNLILGKHVKFNNFAF